MRKFLIVAGIVLLVPFSSMSANAQSLDGGQWSAYGPWARLRLAMAWTRTYCPSAMVPGAEMNAKERRDAQKELMNPMASPTTIILYIQTNCQSLTAKAKATAAARAKVRAQRAELSYVVPIPKQRPAVEAPPEMKASETRSE